MGTTLAPPSQPRLAIGTNHGLAIVNTATSSCVKILSHRISVFCESCCSHLTCGIQDAFVILADAADPEKYQWELSQERTSRHKNNVEERLSSSEGTLHQSLPSIVDSRFVEECERVRSLREQFFPLLQNGLLPSITTSL